MSVSAEIFLEYYVVNNLGAYIIHKYCHLLISILIKTLSQGKKHSSKNTYQKVSDSIIHVK